MKATLAKFPMPGLEPYSIFLNPACKQQELNANPVLSN